MRRCMAAVLTAAFVAALLGCSRKAEERVKRKDRDPSAGARTVKIEPVRDVQFKPEEYPRCDGSTSTWPLGSHIPTRVFNVSDHIEVWRDGTAHTPLEPGSDAWNRVGDRVLHAEHTGTHGAYVNLIKGDKDLILVAREPSADELKLADAKKVALEVRPVALDAFVFIVQEKNSIKNLPTAQIKSIYQGKTTDWKDVGGQPGEIHTYQRDRNSGSQELMEKLFMKGAPLMDARRRDGDGAELGSYSIDGMRGIGDRVAADKQGIGYSVYYYAKFMNVWDPADVRMLAVDGVEPNAETIAARKYPYTAEVFVVIRAAEKPDSPARRLRDWLLTEEGQKVVSETGYVPVGGKNE